MKQIVETLPHDISAEEGVVGSLLIDGNGIYSVKDTLEPAMFFSGATRVVFVSMLSCCRRGEAIDQITVAQELDRTKHLEDMGGVAYLSHLVNMVPTSLDLPDYAGIVHRLSIARQGMVVAQDIAILAEAQPEGWVGKAAKMVTDLQSKASGATANDLVTPEMAAQDVFAMMDSYGNHTVGVSWGFKDLDNISVGMFPQEFLVIGARSGMGKTEIALELAINLAKKGATGLFCSLEMGSRGLLERMIAQKTGISVRDLRRGLLTDEQRDKLPELATEIASLPLYRTYGSKTCGQISSYARHLKDTKGLDFLVVDYIQKVRDIRLGRSDMSTHRLVTEVSQTLNDLKVDLNIGVIALSQMSREVDKRGTPRPMLSDLKESGSLEEDADNVWLLYRPEMYFDRDGWQRDYPNEPYPQGVLEIMQGKHRQFGPQSPVRLQWLEREHRYFDAVRR